MSNFPIAYAHAMGIDPAACTSSSGMTAGGASERLVAKESIVADVAGRTVELAPIFSADLPVILLGREDFFSVFKVVIDQRRQRLSLHPY